MAATGPSGPGCDLKGVPAPRLNPLAENLVANTTFVYAHVHMHGAIEVVVQPASRLFKALGDETRLRIVALLSHGELCVCHVESALGLCQPNASRHLTVLKNAGVVDHRRQGNWVYYRLVRQKDPRRPPAQGAGRRVRAPQGAGRRTAARDEGAGAQRVSVAPPTLGRRVAAEFFGTLLLLSTVVGSGIMGERLSGGKRRHRLAGKHAGDRAPPLVALILTFGPISSGAHFNPVVTIADASQGWARAWRVVPAYVAAQVGGALIGVVCGVAPDVWRAPHRRCFDTRALGLGAGVQRVRRHVRVARDHLGLRSQAQ